MAQDAKPLDAIDRKLLGLLSENAEQSYADLGAQVGLSAPAVHERVKRYKATGRIKAVAAQLDPEATGKPLLAFVHINATGWGLSPELLALAELPEVEEIHSVTGDACLVFKVRTASAVALEALLAKVYAVPNVTSTKSYVVLSTYVERPVRIGVTEELNQPFDG